MVRLRKNNILSIACHWFIENIKIEDYKQVVIFVIIFESSISLMILYTYGSANERR